MQARTLFVRVVVGALCATAGLAISALLTGSFGDTSGRIVLTTSAIAGYALCGMPAGLLLERGRHRELALANAGLASLGFLVAVYAIWSSVGAATLKTLVVVTLFAAATAQTCAIELRRREDDPPSLRPLGIVAAVAAYTEAALGSIAALGGVRSSGFFRLLGAVAVLDVLMIVVIPVIRRGGGPAGARDLPPRRVGRGCAAGRAGGTGAGFRRRRGRSDPRGRARGKAGDTCRASLAWPHCSRSACGRRGSSCDCRPMRSSSRRSPCSGSREWSQRSCASARSSRCRVVSTPW